MPKPGDGVDYSGLKRISLEEVYSASKIAIETLMRLHGLEEMPDEDNDEFWDQLDRILAMLGLRNAMVSPYEAPIEQEATA